MTKYRWIGDPFERAAGKQITPGPWQDLPSDEEVARKIMYNNHYEVEGAKIIEVDPPKPPRPPRKPKQDKELAEGDGWE